MPQANISATLAPDTGETAISAYYILEPGQSVTYTATYGAGDTQKASFQVSDSPTTYWDTVASAVMDGSPDNISGTYKNQTGNPVWLRWKNKQTDTSTDESITVTIASVAEPVDVLETPGGSTLIEYGDELTRFYTRVSVGQSGELLSTTADSQKMAQMYFSLKHTSSYGFYSRSYVQTAGISSDANRLFATVDNVIAGTVRGLHCSLSMGASGTVTGLGVAAEFTLHIPTTAGQTGTIAPIKAAINSDGAASDPVGSSLSYIQIANQGDATGGADVDTDVNLFEISGHTISNGNLVMAAASEIALAAFTHGIRIKIGSTLYYIPISTTAPSGW